jgi:hypothetical protein
MTSLWTTRACALLIALVAEVAVARAQVAVLRIDPEAEEVCRDVEAALNGVGLVADPGYLSEAREQGVDPASDTSLELITPLLQIKLAVVPLYVDDGSIQLEYRDGRNGARLGTAGVPRERGKLGPRGRAQIKREVVTHLGTVLSGSAEPADAQLDPVNESGDTAALELDAAAEGGEAPDKPRALRIRIHAGMGLGTRDVDWTADGRAERVALGAFPAFDLGLSLAFRLSDAVALAPRVDYQSSLAFHEVEEARMAAPADRVGVRAHRFAAVLALPILFDGESSASIAPALGLGIRNLRPEVHHLSTPAYSLAGPLAQLELSIPMGDAVALRVMPEAQWLFVGEGLHERDVNDTGLSLGGELALTIEVLDALSVELSYREAHALLSSLDGSAGDIERFVTLRAVAEL